MVWLGVVGWPPLQPIVREAEESRDAISRVFKFAALIFVMKLTNTNRKS